MSGSPAPARTRRRGFMRSTRQFVGVGEEERRAAVRPARPQTGEPRRRQQRQGDCRGSDCTAAFTIGTSPAKRERPADDSPPGGASMSRGQTERLPAYVHRPPSHRSAKARTVSVGAPGLHDAAHVDVDLGEGIQDDPESTSPRAPTKPQRRPSGQGVDSIGRAAPAASWPGLPASRRDHAHAYRCGPVERAQADDVEGMLGPGSRRLAPSDGSGHVPAQPGDVPTFER
jgi:hypothetical protein